MVLMVPTHCGMVSTSFLSTDAALHCMTWPRFPLSIHQLSASGVISPFLVS